MAMLQIKIGPILIFHLIIMKVNQCTLDRNTFFNAMIKVIVHTFLSSVFHFLILVRVRESRIQKGFLT